jgi:fatty acid desaturase
MINRSVVVRRSLTALLVFVFLGFVDTTTAFTSTRTTNRRYLLRPYCSPNRLASSLPYSSIVSSTEKHPTSSLTAAEWHRERRRSMMEKYGAQIAPLEQDTSQTIGLPLLAFTGASLWGLSLWSASLPVWAVVLLAIFPGSMLSLWQLQLLHDVIHGSMVEPKTATRLRMSKQKLQDTILFWGSMPSIFGYYLYLKAGHLTHHKNLGQHSLDQIFSSDQNDFEDGDMLFVAHRMKLKGDYGPTIPIPFSHGKTFKMSISRSGFHFWKEGAALANGLLFATSFLYERILLAVNDVFVSIFGKNFFFPNKPEPFQEDCTIYARVATALRVLLWLTTGWKALLFLYLSETLWSLPPHPACAMFVTNHGSKTVSDTGDCAPSSSTYAGRWYSIFTLGTNFHCEHHDFPTIPFHQLHKLHKIAPEYYSNKPDSNDNLFEIMATTFAYPEFYACMDAKIGSSRP